MRQRQFQVLSWTLVAGAIIVPFVAWLQSRDWSLSGITLLNIFPLLGIWAWFLMWTHYVTGSVRLQTGLQRLRNYSNLTGWLVLIFLLLHPSLLILRLFQLNYGLPPGSTLDFVGKANAIALYFGVISLIIFLSFEVFRKLKKSPIISRNWRWVSASQGLAMILIFVHGLRLGQHLGDNWMQIIWMLAGIVLLPAMARVIAEDFSRGGSNEH